MIRVFIADDHRILADGLRTLLQSREDIEVVGSGHDGLEVLKFLESNKVDVLLLDINMPNLDGIETASRVSTQYPDVHMLALSMHNKGSYIRKMFDHGVLGYVLKNVGEEELVEAVRTVAKGENYLGSDASKILLESAIEKHPIAISKPDLTRRENEVLQLISKQLTTQEISKQLHISLNTVETHRKNLLSKFGARNSVGLVRAALELDLLDDL